MKRHNNKSCYELLQQWEHGTRIFHKGHHIAASNRDFKGRVLGIGVAISTAVVSSSLFATLLKKNENTDMSDWLSLVSLVPVALASMSNFIKYPELAEKHRIAAANFGDIRKEIETIMYCHKKECDNCIERCNDVIKIKKMWSIAESQHIAVPQKIYNRAAKSICKNSQQHQTEIIQEICKDLQQ